MKYQFVKSPLLLVIFVIAPGCRIADVRDRYPAEGTPLAGSGAAGRTADHIARSDKDRTISVDGSHKDRQIPVDGVVELY
jgi:hypothetical protein